MKDNFQRCLANTLVHEGGYANHPSDPGGATMRGVTQATFNAYLRRKNRPTRHVRTITEEELLAVYREGFWNPVAGDALPKGVDQVVFDGGVNSGPSRGVRWTAQALGNSKMGPMETARRATEHVDKIGLVKRSCANRVSFVRGLGTFRVFGRGWMRRIADVEALGVKMVREGEGTMAVKRELEKGEQEAHNQKATSAQGAAVSGGSGGAGAVLTEPSSFDLVSWLLIGGIGLMLVLLFVYFLYQWKYNRERVLAYKDAIEGRLEATWEEVRKEIFG